MRGTCKNCLKQVESLNHNLNCVSCEAPELAQPRSAVYGTNMKVTKIGETPIVEPGRKDDSGKRDWTLLPFDALEQVVLVLEHGARKYGRDNWKKLDNLEERYKKALMRHSVSVAKGNDLDPETNLPELAHIVCCCLFIMQHDLDRVAQIEENLP